MKKRNVLIVTVLLLAVNLTTELYAQENIRAIIRQRENSDVIETEIIHNNFPIIKKINQSTFLIKLEASPTLEQQLEEAFRQDSEQAIHVVEQKRDGKVSYMFCRFESSTYSYTNSNNTISIIESIETRRPVDIYSFFFNVVHDDFRFPLIGFVNTAIGSHQGLQAGFINTTLLDFKGAQLGFINSTFNNSTGLQAGFVNTTFHELNGLQVGFVNAAGTGIQNGSQIGFVNTTHKDTKGAQIGFVNVTGRNMRGSQIGFLNYADTITGIPIGFLSIVKKGGYRAIEVSVNEWYPVNLSFKIGVPKLYSFVQGGYNGDFEKRFFLGGGFGSLLPVGKKTYFNPEISSVHPVYKNNLTQISSFVGYFRCKLSPNMQIAAGPSVVHVYTGSDKFSYQPIYSIVNYRIDYKNQLVVSARAALSVNF